MLEKLTALEVKRAQVPGYYGDGGGLWLQVSSAGTKSWVFRFALNKRAREMGLGAVHTVSLVEARGKAREKRQLLLEGVDPIEAKRSKARSAVTDAARAVTFNADADAYIESHRHGWKNVKHADQWVNTLQTYAYPHIGSLLVSDIDTALVMKCLRPIWTTKTETASRLRGRIESVLDYAAVLKHRSGDNPARWKGHLENLLPKPRKIARTEHHAALPYEEIGSFVKELKPRDGVSAKALQFTVLTAARTTEAAWAKWSEVDLQAAAWTIPGERMKSQRPHRVPLSKPVLQLLKSMQGLDATYVFPGRSEGTPLSNMAMLVLLQKRMNRPDLTVHGFRSTFRDWAAEQTNFPNEVVEMALAHTIDDPTEAAYRRGDLIEKRTKLMQAWADYCGRVNTGATVTPIHAKTA